MGAVQVPGVAIRADDISFRQILRYQRFCQIVNDKGIC